MAIPFFISICLIVLMILIIAPKRLHLLEILFMWAIITYVKANAYFQISLNNEMLLLPKEMDKYWLFMFVSYTVVPSLIIAGQNVLLIASRVYAKIAIILVSVTCLVALEYWEIGLHILERKKWYLYHSMLFWFSLVLAGIAARGFFQFIAKREVKNQ
ncbi:hypothetical protein [Paenibacillus montanisoli]|uniref:Uncharacterized protein n=1 Tax=Paenibacillus montanisoli TaxID=2081970 RepID=A0A328U6L9_9BACL|nr:hypothetical protein [Paenibacillus montanisoli]RAP75734.1 hypothetical protein DL346_09785 [Paenibacillus montanisoli]